MHIYIFWLYYRLFLCIIKLSCVLYCVFKRYRMFLCNILRSYLLNSVDFVSYLLYGVNVYIVCSSTGLNLWICWQKETNYQTSGIHTSTLRYARRLNKSSKLVILLGWINPAMTPMKWLTTTTVMSASRSRSAHVEYGTYMVSRVSMHVLRLCKLTQICTVT